MSVLCKADVMQSLGWRHFLATNNGSGSRPCCPRREARDVHGQTTGRCSKAFFGCLKPEPDGGTCPRNIPRQSLAGGGCEGGKNGVYGWIFGGRSCANSMSAESWTGARAFWTEVLLPLKKGLRSRKNQTRKGNEVDGGGRRLGYSSGKSACQRKPGRSDAGRIDLEPHQGAPQKTLARRRRPRLRQRSAAGTFAREGYSSDRSASQRTHQASLQRRSLAAPLPQTLEGRTHLRMTGQLPPPGRPLRLPLADVPSLLSSRLPAHRSQILMKPPIVHQGTSCRSLVYIHHS